MTAAIPLARLTGSSFPLNDCFMLGFLRRDLEIKLSGQVC